MLVDIVGLDPSLRNWGLSRAVLDTESNLISVSETKIIKTKQLPCKKTKQNTKDLISAAELFIGLKTFIKPSDILCVEVPHGSQSSRAMVSYGVCIGILGVISTHYSKLIQVSANDVKKIVKIDPEHNPDKDDMINWVRLHHPEAKLPNSLNAEHICDSIIAIHAALLKDQLQEYL